jgi:KilA-N domain
MKHQLLLALIPHKIQNETIEQRASDGYINATAMCKAAGKQFNDYTRTGPTKSFVQEMANETGIPVSELIQTLKGGDISRQGSWVHPDVAINLAQWLSPKFAVLVSKWVREWLSGGSKGIPYHLRRYMANRTGIPYTHFSVLMELTFNLIAPLEDQGYRLPDHMVPDISEGRMFAQWLRDNGIDTDAVPTYEHRYEDGRVVQAKMYPASLLPDFRKHFNEVWLPIKALDYFAKRDPQALPFLDRVLGIPAPKKPARLMQKKKLQMATAISN